ncbi:MAG: hypothetical protein IGBAC_1197 [Ignavibacteriae bacterium]|nr:MAG: hypothetical protein IGBAC_1197 [Ignavibacteriota bacterium]
MNEYPLDIFDNHLIVLIDGKRMLIDTGSHISLSDGSSLSILEENYTFPESFCGISLDQLSEFIGTKINILLGGDVLTKINFYVRWENKLIHFSKKPFNHNGICIPLHFYKNVPVVDLNVNQQNLRLFLDTGAKISYFGPDIVYNFEPLGSIKDFYPTIGNFETKIYHLPVIIDEKEFLVTCGILPEFLRNALQLVNIQGLLGNDIFKYFDLCYNFTTNLLILMKRNNSSIDL